MTIKNGEYRTAAELKGTLLEAIVLEKLHELADTKSKWPAESIRMGIERAPEVRSFKRALLSRSPAIIAEIKKASPSAGILRADFDPLKIAAEYIRAGAAAISVITEAKYFRGSLETLATLHWSSAVPLLRKDFLVDPYQIYESRHAGADAVLLIAALHDVESLKRLRTLAEDLGMDALVEVHDEFEMERALAAGASLIGVNSRNLKTFEVDLETALALSSRIPRDVFAVAESGIKGAADIRRLAGAGYRGFLVGEALLRAASPGAALAEWTSAPGRTKRKAS